MFKKRDQMDKHFSESLIDSALNQSFARAAAAATALRGQRGATGATVNPSSSTASKATGIPRAVLHLSCQFSCCSLHR
jgi:hypothetical protein